MQPRIFNQYDGRRTDSKTVAVIKIEWSDAAVSGDSVNNRSKYVKMMYNYVIYSGNLLGAQFMAQASNKKESNEGRLGMRLSPELKKKIDYAAQLKGVATAGFVKSVLSEAADRAIKEHEFIDLTVRDRKAFVQALFKPSEPSAEAMEATRRYKEKLGL